VSTPLALGKGHPTTRISARLGRPRRDISISAQHSSCIVGLCPACTIS